MRLKISSFLRIVIATVAIASVIAYSLLDSTHPYMNSWSLLLALLFAIVLYAFTGKFSQKYPPAIAITFVLILFVQLNFLALITLPASLLNNDRVTSEILNPVLAFIVIGTIACYLGVSLGYGTNDQSKPTPDNNAYHIDGSAVAILAAAYFVSLVLQLWGFLTTAYIGATMEMEHLGVVRRYLFRLVEPTTLSIMYITAYVFLPYKASRFRLLVVLLFISFVLSVWAGSRGHLFYIAAALLSVKIVVDGDFKFKLAPRHVVGLVSLFPLAFITFSAAGLLRALWYGNAADVLSGFDSLIASADLSSLVVSGISEMSRRVSYVEPTIFVLSHADLGLYDVSDLVNIKTTALSSINRLIPGKPLGNILFTEFAFGYMFSPEGVQVFADSGRVDYVGYEWTMYGISHQLFGFWGGAIFIFGFTALLARIIRVFRRWGNLNGFALGAFFIYTLIAWIGNLGLDNLVDRTVHSVVVLCIYLVGYSIARELLRLTRQTATRHTVPASPASISGA